MSTNGVNYNPYLYIGTKAVLNSSRANSSNGSTSNDYITNNDVEDVFVSNPIASTKGTQSVREIKASLSKIKSEQGLIGKLWDGFKNLTGIGAGSNEAEKAIKDYESGKITREEMEKAVNGYKEGQKQCVDMVADIASGVAAFAAFSLATGLGIAATPFTGGASLGLVAAGFGIAGAAGATVKVGVKSIDCAVGGRKYDSAVYDIATGGINGMFAPITAGIGGAAGKAVAGRVGVQACREGGEVIVKESIKNTVRGSLTKTLLTTNVKYVGGSLGARALAIGTDMAVNGAITGGVDSAVRYIAGDTEDKSLEGLASDVAAGTIGGFILSPIIGGGMRLAGNGIGKLTGKLGDKIDINYTQAKNALGNMPVVDNPDMEVVREFGGIIRQAQDLADNIQIKGTPIEETVDAASDIVRGTIEQAKKIPDTNAFKQLGDLPDRAKSLYGALVTDAGTLDDIAAAGNKILSGNLDGGVADLTRCYEELGSFGLRVEQQISNLESTTARSGISESTGVLKSRLERLMSTPEFQNMTRDEQIQAIMENSNILLSKFAQTFSTDDSLPQEVSKIFKQFTSNCTVSRNMSQAQQFADELYGAGKYTILKSFGAGTIGETYLAKTADGTEVVIKMLKDGVTPERFAEDRALFTKYIAEFVSDPAEKEYKTNLINSMFDAWDQELNFGLEAQGARDMAHGSNRFNVAQTLEVGSHNGQNVSLVMEKAKGTRLDNLLEMLRLYKENPTEYFTKYASEIEANPALKTPEKWMGELGYAYQRAQNEQAMFVGTSGTRTIHADPHPGNVFIDFDAKTGKPIINYIDTGNTVQRTHSQTLQDIGLSINMMFGNSEGIARAMLDGATLPEGVSEGELVKKFAQMLDERLYQAGVNLKSTQYTQNTINSIMKELNVVPNAGNSNLMKATLQRIETSRAINRICGTSSSKSIDIKDLARGIIKSFRVNPKETWKTITPIIKWAFKNNDQAMSTFFQMIIRNTK